MSLARVLEKKDRYVFSIRPKTTIGDCIKLLNEKGVGAAMVIDGDEQLVGILSERDILHAAHTLGAKMFSAAVESIMTPREKLLLASPDESIETAMETMTNYRIRHLPVIEQDRVVGVVSIGDLIKTVLGDLRAEHSHLMDYVFGRHQGVDPDY
jgi:CBS domain-containing protein